MHVLQYPLMQDGVLIDCAQSEGVCSGAGWLTSSATVDSADGLMEKSCAAIANLASTANMMFLGIVE